MSNTEYVEVSHFTPNHTIQVNCLGGLVEIRIEQTVTGRRVVIINLIDDYSYSILPVWEVCAGGTKLRIDNILDYD